MKNLMLRAAGVVASAMLATALAACNGSVPTLTLAQQVTILCSAGNSEIATLQSAGVFTGGAQTTLTNQVRPDFAKVCAQGTTVTTTNLQNIVNATLPALVTIVGNSNLSANDKTIAVLAIGGVGTAVNTAIALVPAATSTAAPAASASGASAASPASAPSSASTVIVASSE